MKRRLWAVVLAALTLTACAELESGYGRIKAWGQKSRGESDAKSESPAAPKVATKVSQRPLARLPRRKPYPSLRIAAQPNPVPKSNAPKPNVSKPIPPKPGEPKPDVSKTGVPKPGAPKPNAPKADAPNTDLVSVKNLDPKLLLGLDFNTTKALLGNPEVEYEQPPAKVWTYHGGTCSFSVFFFPNLNDSVFRVLTYEATGADQATPPKEPNSKSNDGSAQDGARKLARRCFVELLTDHAAPNEG